MLKIAFAARLSLLVAMGLTLMSGTFLSASRAVACSVGPDFDLINDADAIVAGRFGELELGDVVIPATFDDGVDGNSTLYQVPFSVSMSVDTIFKGEVPAELKVHDDGRSLDLYDHEPKYVWTGASGACGAFSSDPRGQYAVIALWRTDTGQFRSSIFGWLYKGDEAEGEAYLAALERLDDRGLRGAAPRQEAQPEPEPEHKDVPWIPILALSIAIPLAFLAVSSFLGKRNGGH